MKRLILASAVILGWAAAALGAEPGMLISLRAVHMLNNEQASRATPVAFEATVTYYNPGDVDLFVEDGGEAVYVETATNAHLSPGDRVEVKGRVRASFRPEVLAESVTVTGHGSLPRPLAADFGQLIRAERDCQLVTVRGVVRSADMVVNQALHSMYLHLLMDGGSIDASVTGNDTAGLAKLLDAEVEVTGVAAGRFDSKNQLTGILLEVSTVANVKLLKQNKAAPEMLPVTPMDEVLAGYHVLDQRRRTRVRGTITYFEPGSAMVLQSGAKSIWIMTQSTTPVHVGNLADATGFPEISGGLLALSEGQIREDGEVSPIVPRPVTEPDLASGVYAFDLVSTEGQVLTSLRQASQDEYLLVANGHLFSAIYHHPDEADGVRLPAMKAIAAGSLVRVTGIGMVTYGSNPFKGPVSFSLLLRSYGDIVVVEKPSWLTVRNLTGGVSVLVALVIAFGVRQWILERKVHGQTIALAGRIEAKAALERRMALLEQRRSRILEDINGSRPLAEIIEQITGLVAFTLNGAVSWCEIADGARLGASWNEALGRRILRQDIVSHSGQALGVLFAALDEADPGDEEEVEALAMGARLALLAIETRRIYSDLLYRSEFDQLTDIHNRFSLDKELQRCIEEARQQAGIFGLIYIDLDRFKQVNDVYGHHVGDLYLREAARRMKAQLRAIDILARLGGDEFAALLPAVRRRADAVEVAQRLERSFDEPFVLDGFTLSGSASVGIALYPEDGASKDKLFTAADAAMYLAKEAKLGN